MNPSLLASLIFFGTVAAVVFTLWTAHVLLIKRHSELGNERLFPRQLIMLGLTLVGVLVTILALPVSDSSRNQLIGLVGILLSGVLAFSSPTVISNLLAGVLLRITKPFKVGDFIRIGDHFGRVSERGLFDTEIQAETRELIALPNSYCVSNPVSTIRSSGTIISTTLTLGYDLDHRRIESLLIQAAESCGLKDAFVHILELGNFAVTYRISGLLEEPKRLLSARSHLCASVLDTLHEQNIEIMSPTFMNQRQIQERDKIIPSNTLVTPATVSDSKAESIAFDKAELAENLAKEKALVHKEIELLESSLKKQENEERKQDLNLKIDRLKQRQKALEEEVKKVKTEETFQR